MERGELDPQEFDERIRQETRRAAELEKQERAKQPQRLDVYVARKELTEGEAIKLRALYRIDQQAARGEIDAQEAEIQRNRVMKRVFRDQLKQKVDDLTAKSVRYLQVFEAMKRISPGCDPGLGFLIENKEVVTVKEGDSTGELRDFCAKLREDDEMLRNVLAIMDRRDHELRLLTIRLPPYNSIMKTGLEKIGNLIIEKDFLEDLRALSLDDMSDRLNDPDQAVRVRPAAEMRCFINLVDHVVKPTLFRRELRMLKIALTIEDFYRSSQDPDQARKQVDKFLQSRLRRLFPDSSGEERKELQERSRDLIEEVEVRVLGKHARGRKLGSGEKQVFRAESTELTPDELEKGVQIGRVKMRVGAGGSKLVPFKIMPDPDDPQKFVIARHDWEKGEVVPQMRRGVKRYVERDREGTWNLVRE